MTFKMSSKNKVISVVEMKHKMKLKPVFFTFYIFINEHKYILSIRIMWRIIYSVNEKPGISR